MVARVMVEFDITGEIPAEVEVEVAWGNKVFQQNMDYYRVPFRWYYCKNTGHVKSRCPFFCRGRNHFC